MADDNGRVSLAQRLALRVLPGRLVRRLMRRVEVLDARVELLERHVGPMRLALGRIEGRQLQGAGGSLREHEFQVFSQWGEDGILQRLVREVALPERSFVEFGVESYEEANTRFLLNTGGWRGLVLDSDPQHVDRIRNSRDAWRFDLSAVCSRVTRDSINGLFTEHGMTGELGLVSIDVDGVDWWLWEALEVARPALVVAEYNYRFGPTDAVTVPYRADFDRRAAHHSLCYFGASLEALARLGRRKGYALVGCGSAGVNAFFVRRDLLPASLPERGAAEAFFEGGFREAHDQEGRRLDLPRIHELRFARALPLVEIDPEGRPSQR